MSLPRCWVWAQVYTLSPLNKGYSISEFFLFTKKCSKSLSWALSAWENAQDSDLEPFLEDGAKVKTLLRIKSPLQISVRKKS